MYHRKQLMIKPVQEGTGVGISNLTYWYYFKPNDLHACKLVQPLPSYFLQAILLARPHPCEFNFTTRHWSTDLHGAHATHSKGCQCISACIDHYHHESKPSPFARARSLMRYPAQRPLPTRSLLQHHCTDS